MKNVIKLFLWLNMLVAIAVVVMGVLIFQDREIIKARKVLLTNNTNRVAQNLNWGGTVNWESAEERKPAPFVLPQTAKYADIEALEKSLVDLAGLATQRVDQLTKHYNDLVATQAVLKDTEDRLATRIRELEDARRQIASLEQTLKNTQDELRQDRGTLSDLQREKSALEQTVALLTSQLGELNSQSKTLADSIDKTEGEFQRALVLLRSCLYPKRADDKSDATWRDVPAQVLAVDPEWNLAIINKGEVDTLPMFMEAFIHRGDKFIGKLRVMRVENSVAIAEILTETLVDGATVQVGDTIFF